MRSQRDEPTVPEEVLHGLETMLAMGIPLEQIAERLRPILDELYNPILPTTLKLGIRKMFRRGMEPEDVAERIGQLLSILARNQQLPGCSACRQAKPPDAKPPAAPTAAQVRRAAAEMRDLGMSFEAIAKELHLSRQAAQNLLGLGAARAPRKRRGARR